MGERERERERGEIVADKATKLQNVCMKNDPKQQFIQSQKSTFSPAYPATSLSQIRQKFIGSCLMGDRLENWYKMGSGCCSVGRNVAFDTRGQQFPNDWI